MDIKNSLEYQHNYFSKHDISGNNRYRYEEAGILIKCVPKILFKGNTILATFLQLVDLRLVMLFKYIDRIKKFKHISNFQ